MERKKNEIHILMKKNMNKSLSISIILCFFINLNCVNSFSQNIDIRVLRSINSQQTLSSDSFFRFMSDSHGFIAVGVPLTIGVTGILRHDREMKWDALEMAAAIAIDEAIVQGLKYTVKRDRPFSAYPDIKQKTDAIDPSFPSGHSSVAFATATALSLDYPEWYVIIPSYTWAVTVTYSRMHLGIHYPSDVIAGSLIGAGSAWLTHHITKKLNYSIKREH